MRKKIILFGVLCSLILLFGCHTADVLESKREVVISQGNGSDDGLSNFLSELQNEIIESITEQTELESDSLAIMLDGGIEELTVTVASPKDAKIDDPLIQRIVEDTIESVSIAEATSDKKVKTKIKVRIEKY